MKRFLWLLLLPLCFGSWAAESEWNTDSVVVYYENQVIPVIQKSWKNYNLVEKTYRQFFDRCKSLPDSVVDQCSWCFSDSYYNLACCLSLRGRKRAAVDAFEQAIRHGYYNYAHVQKDTDLDNIRSDKRFQRLLAQLREVGDFNYILRKSPGYDNSASTDSLPAFTYMAPNDSNLVRVRRYFNLDSIAGAGDEISKIKNLLLWVHNTIRHDGSSYNPDVKNAIAIYEICKREDRGVNCRMMAQMLNECYLAMGFKSRYVTCLPKSFINDCHVINAVYSCTLDKWLWMDPTWGAYVMDEKGNLLGLSEVRDRLKTGQFVTVNEDANWNHQVACTTDYYLNYYMSKNLYYLQCSDISGFDNETYVKGKRMPRYVTLAPVGEPYGNSTSTSNEAWFWASPYK